MWKRPTWQRRVGESLGILDEGKLSYQIESLLRANQRYFSEVAFCATSEQAGEQRDFMQRVWLNPLYREKVERFILKVGRLSSLAATLTYEPQLESAYRDQAQRELQEELVSISGNMQPLEELVQNEESMSDNSSGLSLRALYEQLINLKDLKEFARASILMKGMCDISKTAPNNRFCLVEELDDHDPHYIQAKGIWTTSLLREMEPERIVSNDLEFMDNEDICAVVGSNTGGKTRLGSRAVPEAAYLAYHLGIGPGEVIRMKIPEYISLILKRNKYVDRGRWQSETDTVFEALQDWDEVGRPKRTLWAYDEIGSSTSATDARIFATALFGLLSSYGAKIIFTTHFHELPQALRETLGRNIFVLGTDYFAQGERYKFKRVTDAPSMAIRIAAEEQYKINPEIIKSAQDILDQLKLLAKKH